MHYKTKCPGYYNIDDVLAGASTLGGPQCTEEDSLITIFELAPFDQGTTCN